MMTDQALTAQTIHVGYLGPRGTFTDEAARNFFPLGPEKDTITFIPYRTIPDVLKDVASGNLRYGVVPIENSTEGSVNATLDSLVHDVDVEMTGELVLPIRHHLMVRQGVALQDVEAVISHPQALAQCRKNIFRLLPKARAVAATSTAEAAEQVAASTHPYAALGTRLAASLNGLTIIHSDLQDHQGNATRFIKVGRHIGQRSGRDKTSIVFAFGADKPGNLYRALKAFAEHKVNLTKLESRPAKRSLGDYIFFADMEGYVTDDRVRAALEAVKARSSFFKILGSYPRVDYPRENGHSL